MYVPDATLKAPPDDTVLWRYMDFTKFVSLLEKSALFFCRVDLLGDPFEGSISPKTLPALPMNAEPGRMQAYQVDLRQIVRMTYVNCWHENTFESEAMWRLYAREEDGVAIKTTFDSFKRAFVDEKKVTASQVKYLDYNASPIPQGNVLFPLIHKRISFEHEKEVRALHVHSPHDESDDLAGVCCRVDLDRLVKEIVVAPFAQDWFVELVRSLAEQYGVGDRVRASSLSDEPTFMTTYLMPKSSGTASERA